jgi:hypothetical protein
VDNHYKAKKSRNETTIAIAHQEKLHFISSLQVFGNTACEGESMDANAFYLPLYLVLWTLSAVSTGGQVTTIALHEVTKPGHYVKSNRCKFILLCCYAQLSIEQWRKANNN